jgi:hypothetical protein
MPYGEFGSGGISIDPNGGVHILQIMSPALSFSSNLFNIGMYYLYGPQGIDGPFNPPRIVVTSDTSNEAGNYRPVIDEAG